MDRIRELVGRITELSDEELVELRDLILAELDGTVPAEGEVADVQLSVLEELAEASDAWETENNRRIAESERKGALASKLAAFRGGSKDEETPVDGSEAAVETPAEAELAQEAPAVSESVSVAVSGDTETELSAQ